MAATKHAQKIRADSTAYLTTALLQLLEKKPLVDIKVTELVTRAGVSRMAFYRNFDTLADVLRAYFAPRMTRLFDDVITQVPSPAKLGDMQQFFAEMGHALRLAEKRNYEYIVQQLFADNMVRYYQLTLPTGADDAGMQRYWIRFMSAGVYAIWREWLLSGANETLDEMHELIGKLQRATLAVIERDSDR